jgi:hypothetical protein
MMSKDGRLFAQTVDNGDRIRRLAESVLTGKVRPVAAVSPDQVRDANTLTPPSPTLCEPAQLTLMGAS